ncbi:ABC transporter ATP-binding protein [Magnetospirillum gryphiswaldense]|uniref:ABC-type transport protein, ATP-binding component n=1 Tax=Magnetospirillum gryphiswaldense TaxID=55518 RepID=A4TX06_9PROT|nr:ABC transporter ATP-binding protein [Magnetospirillum gryphiswaldense]AVM74962.1 Daunorubicin/doxorubicin resistance ATP-binding protein DrrA [Magnetospirillum gryphiswaldense MSR-1]AVM78865.1 Daunorubicin/doxorubicin resistance ATP-binding protein DrrA [Magnetospirillum gryphiswaldense]CAM75163.1 ABC-type transport protein, ATP-binding component [Magnetospirillum gryphiswaldense MSR-1]
MIQINSLTHTYPGSRKQAPRTALDNLSLSVREGEFAILSGPNGSGKSTLFRILCGLALPSSGSVQIGGIDLLAQPEKVRRILGVVFQNPAVDKHLSVIENLRIHADLYGIKGGDFSRHCDEALGWTDLADRLNQRVETLSGGLARQVELAKVLMTRPQVLLLDEPTTGLDPASRRNFLAALQKVQRDRGITVLMTSHVFSEAEDVDRVAIMRDGKLLAFDSPQALKAMIGTEMVVVQPMGDAEELAAILRAELGLAVRRHGDELRLEETENGEGLPMLESILERWRDRIKSISIKQPDLEDVFVHVTGRAVPEHAVHKELPR